MKYVRLYQDGAGESHFADVEVEVALVEFAPPAAPLYVSSFTPTRQSAFLVLPVGWYGDWHPVPHRQWFFFLAGEIEVAVSDGERRRFPAGSVAFVEDISGRGHATWNVGQGDAVMAIVQVMEEQSS